MTKSVFDYIGSSPSEEDAAQINSDGFSDRHRAELSAFRRQIIAVCGEPPEGFSLGTEWSNHDFGRYGEIVLKIDKGMATDESVEAAQEFMNKAVEITHWDEHSIKSLADAGFGLQKTIMEDKPYDNPIDSRSIPTMI